MVDRTATLADRLRLPSQLTVGALWAMALLSLIKAASTPLLDRPSLAVPLFVSSALIVLGYVFTATVFITWLYLARENLELRREAGFRWAKGWTIGGWFVPLANLVIPARVVSEVYARSIPGAYRNWTVPRLVLVWWIAFLLSLFRFTVTTIDAATRTAVVHYASFWNAVNGLAGVVAAVLAVRIVARVTAWQAEWRPAAAE
jgi:hypothetical protein